MKSLYINDILIESNSTTTIIKKCDDLDITIPRFCYHEGLAIAGNCRMCFVEVKNSPKPVISCTTLIDENMKIYTNTPLVKKARESALEFLLLNHPIDCPVCDQGGECDLQEITKSFGNSKSRLNFFKRSYKDKKFNHYVFGIMTRCIHCTRCVRFVQDIAGTYELGMTGRGNLSEITLYIENKTLETELSGNIIDLCPVGALTSKPYAHKSRPWKLKHYKTIDLNDALNVNITLEEVMKKEKFVRVLPRRNDLINDEWISDKVRFCYDGFRLQRIKEPLREEYEDDWPTIYKHLRKDFYLKLSKKKFYAKFLTGEITDFESLFFQKEVLRSLGFKHLESEFLFNDDNDFLYKNMFNQDIVDFEKLDTLLIVGTNVRKEAVNLNIKIKKSLIHNNCKVGYIGPNVDFLYKKEHLGLTLVTLLKIMEGKHKFSKSLLQPRSAILFSASLWERKDFQKVFSLFEKYFKNVKILNTLPTAPITNLNILNIKKYKPLKHELNFVYLENAQKEPEDFKCNEDTLKIANVFHHYEMLDWFNYVLPSRSFVEQKNFYFNIEGRLQSTERALYKIDKPRISWKISYLLLYSLNYSLNFKKDKNLLIKKFPLIKNTINQTYKTKLTSPLTLKNSYLYTSRFKKNIKNFYVHNLITEQSPNLHEWLYDDVFIRKRRKNFK